nr:VP0 [Chicken picornavirus 3]
MEQVGAAIAAVSDAAASLAENPVQEIIEGVGNLATTVSTNALVQTSNPTVETGIPDSTNVISDDYLSCACTVDTDTMNVEKTILFGSDNWSSNQAFGTCISRYDVPDVFLNSDSCPAYGQSSYFRFLRCGFRFQITTNPPPGAGGSLILAYMPPGFQFRVQQKGATITGFDPEAVLTLPHVIVDIRSSTHSALTIPYVNHKNYFNYSYSGDHRGTVIVFVLGQYTVGSGTSSNVGVSVFGEMLEADFQCPRPYRVQ